MPLLAKLFPLQSFRFPEVLFCFGENSYFRCLFHQIQTIMKKIIYTPEAPAPIGPYSQAVLAGETLYISGQIAMDLVSKNMVKDSIKNETKLVMEHLKAILKAADMTFDNVVKTNIFLSDMNNFMQVNEVYSSYFTKDFPARATIEARRLPKDANVEISLEAVKL
jgi:2-iminobutanoate/2-iminopropanoate deaminase